MYGFASSAGGGAMTLIYRAEPQPAAETGPAQAMTLQAPRPANDRNATPG